MRERRAGRDLRTISTDLAVAESSLSRLERGVHRPSYDTAVKLAAWLGWTVERVMTAATEPAQG